MEKRYFDVWFRIDYTVCARRTSDIPAILKQADHDYEQTLKDFGSPVYTELNEHEIKRRTFWDGSTRVPLSTLQLGEFISSEF
jgi:hypothetical protein